MVKRGYILALFILAVFVAAPVSRAESGVLFSNTGGDLKAGNVEFVEINVRNIGDVFLNSCKIRFTGIFSSWIESNDEKGLSPGEKFSYLAKIEIPFKAEPGVYFIPYILECEEGRFEDVLRLNISSAGVKPLFLDHEVENGVLVLDYLVEEMVGVQRDVDLEARIIDVDRNVVTMKSKSVSLEPFGNEMVSFEIPLPKGSFGNYEAMMKIKGGDETVELRDEIFIPSRSVITGNASLDFIRGNAFSFLLLFLNFTAMFFIFKYSEVRAKKSSFNKADTTHIKIGVGG